VVLTIYCGWRLLNIVGGAYYILWVVLTKYCGWCLLNIEAGAY